MGTSSVSNPVPTAWTDQKTQIISQFQGIITEEQLGTAPNADQEVVQAKVSEKLTKVLVEQPEKLADIPIKDTDQLKDFVDTVKGG